MENLETIQLEKKERYIYIYIYIYIRFLKSRTFEKLYKIQITVMLQLLSNYTDKLDVYAINRNEAHKTVLPKCRRIVLKKKKVSFAF